MAYAKELTEETALLATSNIGKDFTSEIFTIMHKVLDMENELNFSMDCLLKA